MSTLQDIYDRLQRGLVYGEPADYLRFPMITRRLFLGENNDYIYWQNYGSSASKNTLRDLDWILSGIFKMDPWEFDCKYTCYTALEIHRYGEGIITPEDDEEFESWEIKPTIMSCTNHDDIKVKSIWNDSVDDYAEGIIRNWHGKPRIFRSVIRGDADNRYFNVGENRIYL